MGEIEKRIFVLEVIFVENGENSSNTWFLIFLIKNSLTKFPKWKLLFHIFRLFPRKFRKCFENFTYF